MTRLRILGRNILYYWDIEIAELQSILAIILLSVLMITRVIPSSSPLYLVTPTLFGFQSLSLVVLAIAILHLAGLIFGSAAMRRISSLLACSVWTYLTVAIGHRHDAFAILSLTFVVSSALVYLRLTKVLERLKRII